jgi:type 1 fimbria pilin
VLPMSFKRATIVGNRTIVLLRLRVVGRSLIALSLLGACAVAACSGKASLRPPANAGTVVVHAEFRSAPCSESTGRCSVEGPMGGIKIVLRDRNGRRTSAVTDQGGNARFEVPPGRYRAALSADNSNPCDAGTVSASATAQAHRRTHVRVYCDAP